MKELPNWVLIIILLLAFLVIFFVIVALNIPRTVARKLTYWIKVIWGVIP